MVWLIIPGIIVLMFYIVGVFKLGFIVSDAIDERGSALSMACYMAIIMSGIVGIPATVALLILGL